MKAGKYEECVNTFNGLSEELKRIGKLQYCKAYALTKLEKFEEACEQVKKVTLKTNLVYSEYFSEVSGNKVYLKPENMQYTGAYKVRGAYYKISTLSEDERAKGLITASAGNHAQGVAYAAKMYGVKAVIVMPTTTPLIKVNRTKSYGAEVVLPIAPTVDGFTFMGWKTEDGADFTGGTAGTDQTCCRRNQ